MRALLQDAAVLEDEDAVGEAHGAEAVRDEDGGLARRELAEAGENLVLGLGVERRSARRGSGSARRA